MTPLDRFDRRLGDALEDLASPHFPDYFDDVLARAVSNRQRPAWTFPERWIPMSTIARRPSLVPALPWRTLAIALLLLALLVAGAIISFGLRPDPVPAPFGPAANGLVAYPADGDIYTRDLVTGDERLVIASPEREFGATFSRDGQWLSFLRFGGDESEGATLMVAKPDGTDVRALTGPVEPHSMSWSPASDAIALISSPTRGDQRGLSIVSVDPRVEPVSISVPVEPQGTVEWRPPTGEELIFEGRDPDRHRHAIYGVRPDGTDFRQVTELGGTSDFFGPYEFTPDGHLMTFTDGGEAIHVAVLDLETGDVRPFGAALPAPEDWDGVPPIYSGSASMMSDGDTIVFGRYWNPDGTRINHQLWAASIADDGATAIPIGPVHRSVGGTNPYWQAVAPDGTSVLVFEVDTHDAWLGDPRDGTRTMIAGRELNDPPTWQRVAP